ncbi:uncharacterized protein LY79DRAFT_310759 [Colletotrichum navitas]|uniref:Uncharacterized protein n=1 Tax=Colletotrichum navitas TaxID=681940 RepID=A0AAD8PUR0_9PEZI|nr:uncharacterized protein LY79DRAFT_310759 [Colletotrichum navitas]KAK1580337.1 hypothetical protein LY79DRAFT_310759 [Colletotrichum navitas]
MEPGCPALWSIIAGLRGAFLAVSRNSSLVTTIPNCVDFFLNLPPFSVVLLVPSVLDYLTLNFRRPNAGVLTERLQDRHSTGRIKAQEQGFLFSLGDRHGRV